MARYPPSRTLTDHYGEWCAWCLNYFAPNEPTEFHHVLKRALVKRRFGSHVDFAWVVPVHTNCHYALQARTDHVTEAFLTRLTKANNITKREQLCRQFHDRGYYWPSVLASLDTISS